MKKQVHIRRTMILAAGMLSAVMLLTVAGCGKKTANIPSLKYQVNDDQTITVTGLTDKGQSDTVIDIPAEIDGKAVIAVEGETFRDNQNVTQVSIAEGISRIGENVFLNCGNLEQIDFPTTISEIGTNAVKGSLWEKKEFEQNDEVVINHILVALKDQVTEYTIPAEVTTIASGVFYGNTQLKKVVCPDTLRIIGTYAFSGCSSLTEITLPDQIKKIGYNAFSGCTELTITIPAGITKIDSEAFQNVKQIRYSGTLSGSPWGAVSVSAE